MYKFSETEQNLLDLSPVGRIAFVGVDGTPRVTPVCPLLYNGAIYIETDKNDWKVTAIESASTVAFVVDEYTDNWEELRGVRMQGHAEVISRGDEYMLTKKLLFEKFPQFSTLGWKDGNHVIMKIVPVRATNWGL